MGTVADTCVSCLSSVGQWCHLPAWLDPLGGRSREGIYEATLADNEREAVSDLLGYLENVCDASPPPPFHFTGMLSTRFAYTPADLLMLNLSAMKPISSPANRFGP